MENKYERIIIRDVNCEDDIMQLICEEILYIEKDEYIAVYAKRDMTYYIMQEFLEAEYGVKYIDFDMIDRNRADDIYLILVHGFDNRNFDFSIEPAYGKSALRSHDAKSCLIYMDDCPYAQEIVEYALDSDKDVILFGEADDYEEFDKFECECDEEYDPFCEKCSPECSWYDECIGDKSNVDIMGEDDSYLHVSKDRDGNVNGIMKTWVNEGDGYKSYSSYSYYSTDSDDMKDIAKELGIKL